MLRTATRWPGHSILRRSDGFTVAAAVQVAASGRKPAEEVAAGRDPEDGFVRRYLTQRDKHIERAAEQVRVLVILMPL